LKRAVLIIAALLLGGCQSGPIKLAEYPGERRINDADVVQIALSEHDKTRLDPYFTWVGRFRLPIDSGSLWKQVFVGTPADPHFTVKTAELRQRNEAAGFTGRWTYTIEGELLLNGRTYPVYAEGSRAAAINANSAMRQAVELGIVDAARKCATILAQTK
jgi:hypothetical protein